ncbi:hypothetical protein ACPEIF_34080 [Streptomyces sp. NPDC012600]|uniref:hypothetical protein n=1 Tax=unclassified Streptomyces TaxID=2593676 RepID=UPI00369EC7F9
MLTANRLMWFAITFGFAVPAALVMFRDDDGITWGTWLSSIVLASAVALMVTVALGEGKQ